MPQIYPVANEGQSPDEFGRDAPRVGLLTIPLDNARTLEEYTIGGTMLWAIDASTINARCTVQFQDYTSAAVPYGKGQSIRGLRYSRIYISNSAQAGEFITFFYAVESGQRLQIDNPLQASDSAQITGIDEGVILPVQTSQPDPTESRFTRVLAGVSNDERFIDDASGPVVKRDVTIQALLSNTDTLFIGDESTTNLPGGLIANGFQLNPGSVLTVAATNSLWAVTGNGTAGQGMNLIVAEALSPFILGGGGPGPLPS